MNRVALAVLLLASMASAGTVADLDAKGGFRDVKLGCELAALGPVKLLWDDGDSKTYNRPADRLAIGGAKLSSIHYDFYKGKLSLITIRPADKEAANSIMSSMVEAYGQPPRKTWKGKSTGLYYSGSPNHFFMFMDLAIAYQQKADREAAAKRAAGDL